MYELAPLLTVARFLCTELPERGFKQDLTNELTGAGAPQGRRVPTEANKMPKAWPLLASMLNLQLGW